LDLPQQVSGNQSVNYTYDATGKKLKKVSATGGTTDYLDGIVYKTDGTIDFIQTEEGTARNSSGSYSYEYNLTDHLGNVRTSFKKNPDSGSVDQIQRDDYYAFGLRKVAAGGTNKYLYNGKELQEELGSPGQGQYDYGARFYDPVIARWEVIDPLAEAFDHVSQYNYGLNNPVLMVDQDGMAADTTLKGSVLSEINIVATAPRLKPFVGFWGTLEYYANMGNFGKYHYTMQGEPDRLAPTMLTMPDIGVKGGLNTVYKGVKGGVPYIGKSFNVLKRYTKAERILLKIEPVLADIKDAKLLRAIEQKVLEYKKTLGEVANKINAYDPKKADYAKYMQKAEKWLQENASNWKDLFN
jgi:RHS repeat-associated protein